MATKSEKPFKSIFRKVPKWQDLWFYQKSEVLYQGSLGQAEHRGGQRGRQDIYRDGTETAECGKGKHR